MPVSSGISLSVFRNQYKKEWCETSNFYIPCGSINWTGSFGNVSPTLSRTKKGHSLKDCNSTSENLSGIVQKKSVNQIITLGKWLSKFWQMHSLEFLSYKKKGYRQNRKFHCVYRRYWNIMHIIDVQHYSNIWKNFKDLLNFSFLGFCNLFVLQIVLEKIIYI